VVLGGMLEENFITSMIKSDGNLAAFVGRPIAAGLAFLTFLIWFGLPLLRTLRGRRKKLAAS
jgi:TctA family transporter